MNKIRIKISKKFIYNEYINNKKTLRQIADILKCSLRTIVRALKKHNIKTRTISETRIGKFLGKDNSNYKHGKRCKNYHNYCKCGKEIDYRVKRCPECWYKYVSQSGSFSGKNNPMWQDGISFEPYPLGWTKTFKEQIRYRDGYKCQKCECHEVECNCKLHVHHIDYNKENLKQKNLISLCANCHAKTKGNRDYWFAYFTEIINKIYQLI